ncbi:MAG: TM2 domain-containing protein [Planctomycetales bacterium]
MSEASPDPSFGDSQETTETVQSFAGKKIAAGVCGILLGGLGVHKFILGLKTPGIIMLAVTIGSTVLSPCLFFLPLLAPAAMHVIGLIEGILYLTKSDEEFYQTYAVSKREWF